MEMLIGIVIFAVIVHLAVFFTYLGYFCIKNCPTQRSDNSGTTANSNQGSLRSVNNNTDQRSQNIASEVTTNEISNEEMQEVSTRTLEPQRRFLAFLTNRIFSRHEISAHAGRRAGTEQVPEDELLPTYEDVLEYQNRSYGAVDRYTVYCRDMPPSYEEATAGKT
ncbi:hypothetical protein CHS0354_015995 [Potamilus streckersoni]|uniref:Uncharacterized protein n=1 Tax=Potamilus streckersoni TaxID=2493646 RepID=A0AAE0SZ39_9BIVA|nr:hypothetical protein CHS0354_015995 [Potamilus streckersoni]